MIREWMVLRVIFNSEVRGVLGGVIELSEVDPRLADLLARKPTRVATVAMANKTARIIWAIMARGKSYRAGHRPALTA